MPGGAGARFRPRGGVVSCRVNLTAPFGAALKPRTLAQLKPYKGFLHNTKVVLRTAKDFEHT